MKNDNLVSLKKKTVSTFSCLITLYFLGLVFLSFSAFAQQTGTMTGNDGKTYQTVKIGDQWWMAENLKETQYRDGSSIPNVTDGSNWSYLSTGARCAYDNNETTANTYGYLYNWYAVDDSRNIAPSGWHVPTDAEWQTLVDYLGGDAVAGGKLKETGTTHWWSPNTGATNESGFTALPGGYRNGINGNFTGVGGTAFFWSATEMGGFYSWFWWMNFSSSAVFRSNEFAWIYGFSVRLVKDSGEYPDLTYVSAQCNISYSEPDLTMNLRIINNGNVSAGSFTIDYYLSTDASIQTSDTRIGITTKSDLAPGSHYDKTRTIDVSAYQGSDWYVGFIIDQDNTVAESNEGNNTCLFPSMLLLGGSVLYPPTNLTTLNGYHNAIPVAWEAPQTGTPIGYNIYRSTSSGGSYTKIASNINHQYYRNEDVVNGQTYYYKVTAVYSEGESDFTAAASGLPAANGYKIFSGATQSVPNYDGVINASEWADAAQTIITYPGESNVVTLYTMNDNNYLYLAVDDQGNTTLDNYDTFGILFDENHNWGWPPTNTGEEGLLQLFWNGSSPAASFMGFYGTWPNQVQGSSWSTPTGINLGISVSSGHVQMEAGLDLTSCPLNVSTEDEFGVLFYTFEGASTTLTGVWPQETVLKLSALTSGNAWAHGPFSYGELKLSEATGISKSDKVLPKKYNLTQNYPNPFNPVTTIEYDLPTSADVIIFLYDLKGTEVKRFVQNGLTTGTHSVQWNGKNEYGDQVASGMYFYRIVAKTKDKTFIDVKKMIFMK